jgi:hypothetical protein
MIERTALLTTVRDSRIPSLPCLPSLFCPRWIPKTLYWFDLYSQCYDLAAGNQVSYNETTYNQKVTYVPSFS